MECVKMCGSGQGGKEFKGKRCTTAPRQHLWKKVRGHFRPFQQGVAKCEGCVRMFGVGQEVMRCHAAPKAPSRQHL